MSYSRASYSGSGTRGGKWGFLVAAVVGLPLSAFLFLADALGDCPRGPSCHHGFLLHVLAPTLGFAVSVGLAVRWLANSFLPRPEADDDPYPSTRDR